MLFMQDYQRIITTNKIDTENSFFCPTDYYYNSFYGSSNMIMWLKQTPIQENICIWRTKLIFKLKELV